jgi:hypothetical protein
MTRMTQINNIMIRNKIKFQKTQRKLHFIKRSPQFQKQLGSRTRPPHINVFHLCHLLECYSMSLFEPSQEIPNFTPCHFLDHVQFSLMSLFCAMVNFTSCHFLDHPKKYQTLLHVTF